MNAESSALEQQAFLAVLGETKREVDEALAMLFDSLERRASSYGSPVVRTLHALRDLTLRGGKRLRPALLSAAYLAVGGRAAHEVTQAGVALELLQSYFLIHDDWMDRDDVRRGGPSVHAELAKTFGSEHEGAVSAILAGDLAVSLAQHALSMQRSSAMRLVTTTAAFAALQIDVVFGQLLDVHQLARQRSDVECMHDLKTTSYTVSGPIRMGAALGGADPVVQAALRHYSAPLGLAFQIRDDLLGTFGDPRLTGKPVGNDIREGKRTALVLKLLDDPRGRELMEPFLDGKAPAGEASSDAEIARIVEYMTLSGARAWVERRLRELLDQARAAVAVIDLSERGRLALLGAVAALGERKQ